MSTFRRYARYLLGSPALYKIYRYPSSALPQQQPPSSQSRTPDYTPSYIETITTTTITYVVPLTLILAAYNRRLSYVQYAVVAYLVSHALRSLMRFTNPDYNNFLKILEKARENPSTEAMEELRCYDFEFKYFPVLYSCNVDVKDYVDKQNHDSALMYYVSWLIAHSFGIRLIYPGLILGGLLKNVLEEGREKLINEKGGVRVKVQVESGDGGVVQVDACEFDRRGGGWKSEILVICCEGNAGFYEIGMLGGALSEGYSVLGWNHPGFGGSTGVPYPATELTAALGIMDYAINVMGFKEEQIIVYGWSIGGFPATYLASRYPNIKGLLLDATFDDIMPLAIPRMPEFMSGLVVSTIRNHVNLMNTENLANYKGPLRIIRRLDDEIIADPPGQFMTNRGNHLLVDVVLRRVRGGADGSVVVNEEARNGLVDWINNTHDRDVGMMDCLSGDYCNSDFKFKVDRDGLVMLASSILRDYKSTHCTPLPREFYRIREN